MANPAQAQSSGGGGRIEIDRSIYNPHDPDFIRYPWDVWQRLVRDYPIAYHTDLRMWTVNSHELCADILKNPKFTPNWSKWEFAPAMDPNMEITDFERMMMRSLTILDPASHLRMRKLTLPAFSRKVMSQIEGTIKDLIVEAFDKIGDVDEFDVYKTLAEWLPSRSIARMVGVPLDAEELFHDGFATHLTKATRVNLPMEERLASKRATQEGFDLFKKMVAERRALPNPGDDFLGTLIKTKDENGDHLDDWDIISLITALVTAGSDTAIDLYTYAFKALLENKDQFKLLMERPELMEAAIHEIVRHGSPGIFGIFRYALEDQEFGGQFIRKGEACVVNLSTAWNDPKKCPNPEKFDITRPLEGNIIFGAGPHFCIGTFLVRAQGQLAIHEFAKRYPNATLKGDINYDVNHHQARRIDRLTVLTNRNK